MVLKPTKEIVEDLDEEKIPMSRRQRALEGKMKGQLDQELFAERKWRPRCSQYGVIHESIVGQMAMA